MTIKKSKKKVITVSCLKVKQGKSDIYALKISAKTLWKIVQINARDPDKDQGYQRVLSPSRVRSIARYIDAGNCIPTSILIAFEKATVVDNGDFINLVIDDVPNSGWVIDGQHRLAGAHQATKDIELPVVAFVGLDIEEQIKQFITINKEAKGVPASLYYDLLSHLPIKSASERAKDRAADIATELRNDEESPFFARIVITTTPIKGELSLNNFVKSPSACIGWPHIGTLFSARTESNPIQLLQRSTSSISKLFQQAINSIFPDTRFRRTDKCISNILHPMFKAA